MCEFVVVDSCARSCARARALVHVMEATAIHIYTRRNMCPAGHMLLAPRNSVRGQDSFWSGGVTRRGLYHIESAEYQPILSQFDPNHEKMFYSATELS